MKVFVLISLFQIFVTFANCGKLFVRRPCSSYNLNQTVPFEFERFVGQWYEIAKYENQNQTFIGCTVHNITYNQFMHRSFVKTYTKQKNAPPIISNGTIIPTINVNGLSWQSSTKNEDNILVLGTDYNNYAVLWHCIDHPFETSSQNVTILSKFLVYPNALPKVGDILQMTGIQNDSIRFALIEREQCPGMGGGSNYSNGSSGFNNNTGFGGGFGGYSPGAGRPNSGFHLIVNLSLFALVLAASLTFI